MNAIQLDLFTGLEISSPMNPETEPQKQVSKVHIENPCIGCDLREWCGNDDCAKKGYPIDLPTTRFANLNDMITYFRTHDILFI
jgi:hypothetical protein